MLRLDHGIEELAPRRLLGRASLAGVGTVCQQLVAFLSGLIVARVLGAAEFGIVNLARALVDAAAIVTRLGLDIGLQRYFGETNTVAGREARIRVLRQVRTVAAVVALLPALVVALGFGRWLEAGVYQHTGFAEVLLCLALALPFATDVAILGGAYRGVLKFAPAVLAECILLPVVRLLVIVALFMAGWRMLAVVVGMLCGSLIASVWLARQARRDFATTTTTTHAPGSWSAARGVMRYSGVLAVAVLVTTLTSTMDLMMLGRFASAEQLGQYSLAKTLIVLIGLCAVAFNQGLGALVADRYFRGDRDGLRRVMSRTFEWVALGTLPVFAVFLFWGGLLLRIFGVSFTISPAVVAWLATGQFVMALFGTLGWTLSMTGRHFAELGILLAGLLLAIVLCLMLVPAHGQLGAALSTCAAAMFINAMRMLYIHRSLGGLPFEPRTLGIVAAGLALAGGIRLVTDHLPLGVAWNALLGIGCFALLYGLGCLRFLSSAATPLESDAHALARQG